MKTRTFHPHSFLVCLLAFVPAACAQAADRLSPDKALQRDVAESYWPRRHFRAEDVLNGKIAQMLPESPIYLAADSTAQKALCYVDERREGRPTEGA
jgi:hypothetical protein